MGNAPVNWGIAFCIRTSATLSSAALVADTVFFATAGLARIARSASILVSTVTEAVVSIATRAERHLRGRRDGEDDGRRVGCLADEAAARLALLVCLRVGGLFHGAFSLVP